MSVQSTPDAGQAPASLYDAFISYSHAKDKPVAAALQGVMQKLGKPWYRRRALRIFRDDTSLAATPELWPTLEKTLDQSRHIIILASPEFARSKWCGMEVAHWLAHKQLDTLLVAVTDGELVWDDASGDFRWDDRTPLPPALRGKFRTEPKWIDLRAYREAPDARTQKFVDASADLAAAVHGIPKEDLLSQEVRQQKRALRLAWSAAASLLLLAGGAGWQWWEAETAKRAAEAAERVATEQRGIAETQRDRAEHNLRLARQAADDLVFKVAQGLRGVEGMQTASVRQILGTAQEVMDKLVASAPGDLNLKRSRFAMLHEFAVTYTAAGDLARASEAAEASLALARELTAVAGWHAGWERDLIVGMVKVGDIRSLTGDLKGALAAYEEGLAAIRKRRDTTWDRTLAEADLGIMLDKAGRLRRRLGDVQGARSAFEESTAIRRGFVAAGRDTGRWQRELASGLDDLGTVYIDLKDVPRAAAAYEESLALRRRLVAAEPGNLTARRDLVVSLQRIGNVRDAQRNEAGKAAAFEEALAVGRTLAAADPGNASWQRLLGVTLFQMGDLRLAARDAAGARAYYGQALAVRRKLAASDPRNAQWALDMVTGLFRLATVSVPAEARPLYAEALALAETLVREGRLQPSQMQWPGIIRQYMARLPPEVPAAPAAGGAVTEARPAGSP